MNQNFWIFFLKSNLSIKYIYFNPKANDTLVTHTLY